jgi:hypothetical protein
MLSPPISSAWLSVEVLAVLHEVLGHLQRQFARRLQDQAARHPRLGPLPARMSSIGRVKPAVLPGRSAPRPAHPAPSARRDGLFLDGGGVEVARFRPPRAGSVRTGRDRRRWSSPASARGLRPPRRTSSSSSSSPSTGSSVSSPLRDVGASIGMPASTSSPHPFHDRVRCQDYGFDGGGRGFGFGRARVVASLWSVKVIGSLLPQARRWRERHRRHPHARRRAARWAERDALHMRRKGREIKHG